MSTKPRKAVPGAMEPWLQWQAEIDRLLPQVREEGAKEVLQAWRTLRERGEVPSLHALAKIVGGVAWCTIGRRMARWGLPPPPLGRGPRNKAHAVTFDFLKALEERRHHDALLQEVQTGLPRLSTAQLEQIRTWLQQS